MKKIIQLLFSIFLVLSLPAQTSYRINIDQPEKNILRGHLDLGGGNPDGEKITVNSYYIEKNGQPFYPVIGEFHYSRFPEEYWEEEILKMKSGGINVIATYVFWNIHERTEGQFDWSGDLNLRKFLQLIDENNLYAIVRMGPFCHGEMRNGGIPDWLYGRSFEIRSNDPEYLGYVDHLYNQISDQMNGLLFKDGGPVIGVQLENEYQHSAAPWEFSYPGARNELTVANRDADLAHEQIANTSGVNPWAEYGKKHMATLKAIAKKNGIDVPLYTATGWGNATIIEKGSLPVTAGYAYPFWAEPNPSPFYLFKDIHKNPDYSPVSYNTDLYPSIPCEIGPGIQSKFSRRPIVPYESLHPLMVRIIGSGSNGIGYYMYHGGSTPQFDGKFYNEEVNGLPRINYDFQAPIGQYGQVRNHYKHLRMLHMFLEAYSDRLAPMKTVLPETNMGITPGNTDILRYAVRSYGDAGFLFLINFQDHIEVKEIKDVSIKVETNREVISFPSNGTFNIPTATSAILPFNLTLDKATIKSATVQPLTILHRDSQNYYIFSSLNGIEPEINFSAEVSISNLNNASVSLTSDIKRVKSKTAAPFSFIANGVNFLIIPHDIAMNAAKIGEDLFISDALILEDSNSLQFISLQDESMVHIFPGRKRNITSTSAKITREKSYFHDFDTYSVKFEKINPDVIIEKISSQKYTLTLNTDFSKLNDVFINIDYIGDRGMAFINGKMITDHFYQERKWEIGLKGFTNQLRANKMVLIFHPMYSNYSYLDDLNHVPKFEDEKYLEVNGFEVVPEYKAILKI